MSSSRTTSRPSALLRRATQFQIEALEKRVLLSTAIAAFGAQQTFGTGSNPSSVAIADVNLDGKPDLVLVNLGNTVGAGSVLVGNGNGTFQAQRTFNCGTRANSVAISDVNGDGKTDIIVTNNNYGGSASVVLGNGDGTFQAAKSFATGTLSFSATVADLNRDGKPDLIVANRSSSNVSVLLGNGNGTFQTQQTFGAGSPLGSFPQYVVVSDVNGDGKPDLVVVNNFDSDVSVLLGNGDGTFGAQQTFAAGLHAFSLAIADVNGDGKADVIVADNLASGTVSALLGNGNGTFAPRQTFPTGASPYSVAVADVNVDGKPDLIVTNGGSSGVSILLGNGNGTFQSQVTFATDAEPYSLGVADLNSDGRPDLAIANFTGNTTSVLIGDVPPSVLSINRTSPVESTTSGPTVTYTVTFNEPVSGVDATDFAVVATGGAVATSPLIVNGSGAEYLVTVNGISGVGTVAVRLVDDGSIHDAAGNALEPSGTLSLGAQQVFASGPSLQAPISDADINRDGKPDLIIATQPLVALLGNGDETFEAPRTFGTGLGTDPLALLVADVNGDGHQDVIAGTGFLGVYGHINVFLGNGDGTFQSNATFPCGAYPRSLAAADVNGDGRLDIVVANVLTNVNTISVLLGNGTGSFQPPRTFATGARPGSVAVADLNMDGKPDIVLANSAGNSVGLLIGNGNGTFQGQRTFLVGAYPQAIAVADINGDGRPDVAVVSKDLTGAFDVLLGNGDGTFQIQRPCDTDRFPKSIAIADINGDGNLDLVSASYYDGNVGVVLGNGDGTFKRVQEVACGKELFSSSVSDVNGDGRADIVAFDVYRGQVLVLSGNSDGSSVGQSYTIVSPPIAAFRAQQTFAAASNPRSIAVGEVSADGKPDLIVANSVANTVGVLLGNGNGTFAVQQTFAVGTTPFSVAVSDINGDGKPDLLSANNGSNNVSVLLGNGNGTFGAQTTIGAGTNARFVAVADINGDGKPDLAIANYGANTISVLLGNGNGTFQNQLTFSAATKPSSIAVADFNVDGKLDLAAANKGSNNLSILLGNGNGTFQSQFTFATGTAPFSVAAAYLNQDGKFDLAVADESSNAVSVLLGNGNGTFQTRQTFAAGTVPCAVAIFDVNGDGKLDVVVANYSSNNVSVLLGNGNGSLQAQKTFATGTNPFGLAVADVNRDGRQDLLVANEGSTSASELLGDVPPAALSINRTNPPGPSTSASTVTYTVTFNEPVVGVDAGDFALVPSGVTTSAPIVVSGTGAVYTVTISGISGNGTLGLNLVDNGSIRDAAGNPLQPSGAAVFQPPRTFAAGPRPFSVAIADVNDDGKWDIALGNANGNNAVSILLGSTDGTLQSYTTFATSVNSNLVAVADVNVDGHADLIVPQGNYAIGVLLGNGNGTFQAQRTFAIENSCTSIAISDVNGDGQPDLVFTQGATTVAVALGNGNGTFQPQNDFFTGSFRNYPRAVAVADVDGDGRADLLVANSASPYERTFNPPNIAVFLGNGNGTFKTERTFATGTGSKPYSVAVADMNGDGHLDVVVLDYGTNCVGVFLGNGNGTFQAQQTFSTGLGTYPRSVAVSDFNGDGRPDVITTDYGKSGVGQGASVLLGNGNGTLQNPLTFAAGRSPRSLAVSDINGDGRPDLITTSYYTNTISVLLSAIAGDLSGQTYTIVAPPDVVTGTAGNDNITITKDSDGTDIDWTMGASTGKLPSTDPNGLTINGNGGSDSITVNTGAWPNILHLNGTFTITGLSASNSLANTNLEMGRSTVFVSYSSSDPLSLIQGYLKNGYNNGAWNGTPTASTGVITSVPAASNAAQTTAIGYADSADGLIAGQPVNTIELKYTLYGDTTLIGSVGFNDFTRLTQHYNQTTGGTWDTGDFNYDGSINSADFTLMTRTYNTTLGSQALPAISAAAAASKPAVAASGSSSGSADDPRTPLPAVQTTEHKHPKSHGGKWVRKRR